MKTGSQFRSRRFSAIAAVLFCIVAMLVLGFAAGAGNAAQTGRSPIRSASEIDYPPFCIVDAQGRAGGFSVELMRAALAAMGREVTFRTGPWNEVRGWLDRGEVQALPLVGRTPEREALFDFTFPYMSIHGAIVVREDTRDIHDLGDLKGRRVAVMQGDNAEEFLRRENRGIEIHTTATFDEALRELSKGRWDAVVIQRLVALRLIQEAGLINLRIVNKPIENYRQDFCFAVREGDRETLALLNEGLALVMADGTYRHLHAKWFAALQLPSHRRIVVGGDHNFPPYEYLDEKGLPTGYNVELTRAIAREMGLDIEIRLGPWAEVREALARGDIDAVQGMFYSPERDLKFDFSQAHILNHCVSVVRRGEGDPPATVGELADRHIVVQRGDIMHDFALENGLGKEVSAVDAEENALRELAEGKHDCALVSRVTALYCIKKEGWTNLVVGRKPLISTEYCYAVPNNHRPLLAQFSEGLKVLEESGEYRRIYEKWMGIYREEKLSFISLLRYVAMFFVPLILILLAVFLWSWFLRRQVASRTAELAAVSQRHRAILAAVPDIIVEVDPSKIFTWANQAGFDFFGDDVIGREAAYYFAGEQDTYDTVKPLFDGDENVLYIESRQRRKDGEERLLAWWCRVLKDSSGTVTGALSTARDITDQKRAEETLRENEEKYRLLTERMQDIVWIADMDLRTTYVSPSVRTVLGFSREERMRMSIDEQLTPDSLSLGLDALAQELALEEEKGDPDRSATLVLEYYHKDGSTRWMETIISGVRNDRGVLTGLHGVSRDITDRKKAEEALRESEEKYRTILESIEEGYWEVDLEGKFTFFNNAMPHFTGYSPEELMGMSYRDYSTPQTQKRLSQIFNEVYRTGEPSDSIDHEVTLKDGRILMFEISVFLMRDREENPIGFRGITRDITKRKEMEATLRESEEKYRTILETIEHGYWEVDLEGKFTFFNNAMSLILGYSRDELMGVSYRSYTTPKTQKRLSRIFRQVYETGKPTDIFDHEIIRKDSSTAISEMSVSLMRDQEGNPIGFRGISRDITKRKEMEEELRESEKKYRELIDGMNETVWVIDFNGTLIDVNNTAVELLGYSKEELLEIGLYGIDSKLKKDDIKALAGTMRSDQLQIFETFHTTKDGRTFPVEVYSSLVTYQGKPAILSIARDITDRKQAEEELRESEERYRMIVERMSDIVWMTDMSLRTTFVTPSLQTVLGFTPEERMLQPIEEQMTPDSLSYASNLLAEELAGEEGGEVNPDRTKTVELEYYHKDGSTRWMETTVTGIRDDQGVLTGLLGVFRDITNRRQAAEQLQGTLERLRKAVAATIQVMVSAVEIRDPYTAGHQTRSADLARAIATEMKFTPEQIENIRMATSIHDIGKLSVPAEILSKPTQLSPIEFALIKEHPKSGYEILKNVETDWPLAEIIYQHHERMDGSGYPRNLKGDEILMEARIMAVADVVESMASHRPYRAALGIETALEEIENNRGTLYDDAVADACLRLFREKGYQLP